MLTLKKFAKKIGSLQAILSDTVREEKFKEMNKFLNSIGSMLGVLE